MIKGRYVAQIEIDFSYMSGARPQSISMLNTFRERLGGIWMDLDGKGDKALPAKNFPGRGG